MHAETIGIGLVGVGGIGRYHAQLWSEVPGAKLVGVYDVVPAACERAAKDFGVEKVYATLDELVNDPALDAVDVCTPNNFHKPCVLAALNAGKHCLCEKPLAADPADIEAMIAARDASGKMLMTAQHMRFEQRTQSLKRLIAAGRLGEIYYSRAWWLRRRSAPATPGFLKKAQAGYGPGMDLGVHMLDLAMYLLGQPRPVSVSGFAARKLADRPDVANQWGTFKPADFEVEEFATGFIRFANNTVLSLEVSWLLNQTKNEITSLCLHGTEGGAEWPEVQLNTIQDGLLADIKINSELGGDGHRNEMTAFVNAIRAGEPSPVPPEQSLIVARTLAALYESAAAGREIKLPSV